MVIDGYAQLVAIGRGGAATVYRARRESDGVAVAIKLFHGADPRAVREAEALRRVGAPTAPELLATGQLGTTPYLVLELMVEPSLASEAMPDSARALQIVQAIARALGVVHRAGVVHRDLKPAHVILRPGGEVTLLDFGLALIEGEPLAPNDDPTQELGGAGSQALTAPGTRMGTALYMPPEQARGARAGPLADLYSLAVMAFELLTGAPPFTGEPAELRVAHITLRPPSAAGQCALPEAVDDVFARALAKQPEHRHASAADFVAALGLALAGDAGASQFDSAPRAADSTAPIAQPAPSSLLWVGLIGGQLTVSTAELGSALAPSESIARLEGERAILAVRSALSGGDGGPSAAVRAACGVADRLQRSGILGAVVVDVARTAAGRRIRAPLGVAPVPERHPGGTLLTAAAALALPPGATVVEKDGYHRIAVTPAVEASASDPGDLRAWVRELLAPAEFVPDGLIDRIVAAADGDREGIAELVRALRSSGGVRSQFGGRGLVVADDELLASARTGLSQAAARALLEPLPADLRRFAGLCAVIGEPLDLATIDAVQRAVPEAWLDARVGLRRLQQAGILGTQEPAKFCNSGIAGALAATTAAPDQLHLAACRWLAPNGALPAGHAPLRALARHASRAGCSELAARAYRALAAAAAGQHRYLDAELALGRELRHLADGAPERASALLARADVRYRVHRMDDALDDLATARQADAEPILQARAWLAEAMIRDWMLDIEGSADAAARAEEVAGAAPELEAGLQCARGRTAYRQERLGDAIEELSRAVDGARDDCTRLQALLLLAPSLLYADRLDDSESCYQRALELCDQVGDRFHASALLVNRDFLWVRRGLPENSRRDLERAIELSHSLGNAAIERAARHNLAETLHWLGDPEGALEHAQRSRELQRSFTATQEYPDDAILVARILVALGQDSRALAEIDSLAPDLAALPASARLLCELVRLAATQADDAAWQRAGERLQEVEVADVRLEFRYQAARAALGRQEPSAARRWIAAAQSDAARSQTWRERLTRFAK